MRKILIAIPVLVAVVAVTVVAGFVKGEVSGATGGGGVFVLQGERCTFGFHADGGDLGHARLVFRGRDAGVGVQSLAFMSIEFDESEGAASASAWGWAEVDGQMGYWFDLRVTDNGDGGRDSFHLTVWHDDGDKPGAVDPNDTIASEWGADGLDGGNVWVTLPA